MDRKRTDLSIQAARMKEFAEAVEQDSASKARVAEFTLKVLRDRHRFNMLRSVNKKKKIGVVRRLK